MPLPTGGYYSIIRLQVLTFLLLLCRQGVQGTYDTASKVTLASEFDTEDVDEIIKKILTEGDAQVSEVWKLQRGLAAAKYSSCRWTNMFLP